MCVCVCVCVLQGYTLQLHLQLLQTKNDQRTLKTLLIQEEETMREKVKWQILHNKTGQGTQQLSKQHLLNVRFIR